MEEICNKFNVIPIRNTHILLQIVLRNLATIVRSLVTLSKNVILFLKIVKVNQHVVNQTIFGSQAIHDKSTLALEIVQQMIILALVALGLLGKRNLKSLVWLVDFGASNHMTSSFDTLSNVLIYHGATNIQIVNDTQLPIHAIGNINSSIRNVCVSPKLSTSLISV